MLSLTIEQRSWLHGVSVPLKLFLMCAFTLVMLPVTDWRLALGALVVVILLYGSAGIVVARIGLSRLRPLFYLLAAIFLYYVVTDRFLEGIAICSKLMAAVGLANLVTMTSRLDDMMAVVETLSKPLHHLGLPPRALGFAMGLVIRFTPIFLQKGALLGEAWRARNPKRTSPRLLVPLALGALDDADRVADALRARGGLVTPTATVRSPTSDENRDADASGHEDQEIKSK